MSNPGPGYDFCYTPQVLRLHGAYSFDFVRETQLRPMFHHSKFARNPEFLSTPLQAFDNNTADTAIPRSARWEEKTINKLFWRGSSTGDSYTNTGKKDGDWRRSHRPRLHLMMQQVEGDRDVYVKRDLLWRKETWSNRKLNEVYMDVGLSGQPHQVGRGVVRTGD